MTRHRRPYLVSGALLVLVAVLAALAVPGFFRERASDTPTDILSRAALDLESRLGPGGSGISFEVLQRQRPPAPATDAPRPSTGAAPSGYPAASAYITRGFARRGDFYMAIRAVDPSLAIPSFEGGLPIFEAIVADGHTWRQEGGGGGFYQADVLPGLGIDPATLSRFPDLLRHLASVQDMGQSAFDGTPAQHLRGLATATDWPGFLATDAQSLTASPFIVDVWISPGGRLLGLEGTTHNLNESAHGLLVSNRILFGSEVPSAVPQPSPLLPPVSPQSIPTP